MPKTGMVTEDITVVGFIIICVGSQYMHIERLKNIMFRIKIV